MAKHTLNGLTPETGLTIEEEENWIRDPWAEENKKKASELIKKAIGCVEKMEEAKKQFNSEMQKSEKELNKLISSIEALGGGK